MFKDQIRLEAKNSERRIQRLPKIVINKKNFVFKDAIEQIRKERRRKNSQQRDKRIGSFKSREVLSEEPRSNERKLDDEFNNFDSNPFSIDAKVSSKRRFKVFSKKMKKRISNPIRLDFEESKQMS